MKRTAWLLALSLACIPPGFADEHQVEDYELRGAVREVEETHEVWDHLTNGLRHSERRILRFTTDGLLQQKTTITNTGRRRATRYAYDAEGRAVEVVRTDSFGVFVGATDYDYLPDGRVRTTEYRDANRTNLESETLQDAAGYWIARREFDRDGELRMEFDERRLGDTVEYVENRYFIDYVRTTRAVFRCSDRRILSQQRTTEPPRTFLPDWEWRYRYDGPVLREAWFDYRTRPTVGYRYDHDDHGRVRAIERYQLEENGDILTDRRTITWNGENRATEVVEYVTHRGESPEVLGRLTYTFDEQERVTALGYRDDAAGIDFEHRYSYRSDEETAHVLTNAAGYVMAGTTREYDTAGRLLEETDLGPRGSSEVRVYDADGLLGERTTYDRYGQVLSADEYRYDDLGNRTVHAEYGVGRQLQSRVRSEYEYDAGGNWTSRTEYHTDNLRQEYDVVRRIVTREFRYY